MPIYRGFPIAILIAKGGKDGFPWPILDPLQKHGCSAAQSICPSELQKLKVLTYPSPARFPRTFA